jgi:hypothetical protein
MSSELERLLREAGERLPGPAAETTRRVRERALGPWRVRRPLLRRRTRAVLALVGALALTAGLGTGLGLLIAPSGTASGGAGGLGFIPASGWRVLQSGADATPTRPALAVASNVPLAPADDARGIRDSSGLPYSTLLTLPPRGIVIVATFTVPNDESLVPEQFPRQALPLRLRDATPFVQNGVQVRPDRPLGEYELRARVGDRDVDVHFYFGTRDPDDALATAAQEQLDRLVVRVSRIAPTTGQRALPLEPQKATVASTASVSRVIDRTLGCTQGFGSGTRRIDVIVRSGFKPDDEFEWQAQATIATPGNPLPRDRNYLPTLAAVTAGWPPKPPLTANGLGFSAKLCKPTRQAVPFSRRGLSGSKASQFGEEVKCFPRGNVLIHVRASFAAPTPLRLIGKKKDFYSATGHVLRGQIAVRTRTGKPLVYAEALESGKATLFTAGTCTY